MKRFSFLPLLALFVACQAPLPSSNPAPGANDVSYAFGLSVGEGLAKTHVVLDWAAFDKGLKEAYAGQAGSLTADQVATLVQTAVADARTKRSGENALSEKSFLESNARKTGVKTTPSGLQYEVLTEGSGPSATATSTVTVKYQGLLVNGTVFEDTTSVPQPKPIAVAKLLPGFQEGILLMKAGSRYRLTIPSALAYAGRGRGDKIEPNVPLVYEVELLSVK